MAKSSMSFLIGMVCTHFLYEWNEIRLEGGCVLGGAYSNSTQNESLTRVVLHQLVTYPAWDSALLA